ncbi:SDR family oxidoreductase [Lacticaseibacillus jixiensis]|uniref:SDR family oxidoreductase n=1 Tax=Lacticaseibacillus jixiensis TaxID=3231926 RepID=UPI0036F23DB7
MKIFVIGAHGQVGQHVIDTLLENDYQVVAGYRDPEHQAPQATTAMKPVLCDLTGSIADLAKAMQGCDGVIFAAGSRGKALLAVDLDGAVKAMEAAQLAGIPRFIHLSTLNAENRAQWPASLNDYYIAKYYADEWLQHHTTLDYVIVQPTTLTNDEPTGAIKFAPTWQDTITRADVATVLVEALEADQHRTTIKIANGNLPIAQAL